MSASTKDRSDAQQEWIGEQEEELFLTITLLHDSDEVRDFLIDIFTDDEIQRAAKRWCAAQRLLEGNRHVDVEVLCDANKNTVSRAKKTIVKFGTGMSQIAHQRLREYEKKKD